jgi:hypothetical protein
MTTGTLRKDSSQPIKELMTTDAERIIIFKIKNQTTEKKKPKIDKKNIIPDSPDTKEIIKRDNILNKIIILTEIKEETTLTIMSG